ncbi:MAG: dimethylallyltranstransferase [Actinobacteria bacterium 13_2_20CM_2_71_6]|nr:MAG: dimethylallyltranstransferase [Actinobacteria bacterium 13_2_20CM_2_71_6]
MADVTVDDVRPVDVDSVFERVQQAMAPRLRAAVDRLPAAIRGVVGYHFGWYDGSGRSVNCPAGKLLRPALTLSCAQAVGGSADRAVDAALAVELVHNFSLLHDDVMDGDVTRRHRRAVWSQFGVPAAILAGDALLALAVEVLAESGATPATATGSVSTLCVALRDLVEGQCKDISFERRDDVTVEECLAMAGGKTAALLRCACELGAVHGGGTPAQVSALARFGWHLGVAFQLVDDLLGIWGDPQATGKPSLADLRARKKTLPVVAALAAPGARGRRLAQVYLRPDPLTERDLATVAALVELAGGRRWAQTEAQRQLHAALGYLKAAEPVAEAHEALVALAALVTRRDR